MEFIDGGVGWSQFILPDEKKMYRKELKWLKFENKKKECIKWVSEEFTEDEVVFLCGGDWQPKKWRTSHSAPPIHEESEMDEEIEWMEQEICDIVDGLQDLQI